MESILSGAFTGGTLAARAGARVALNQFLVGGVILAGFEGIGVFMSRKFMPWMNETFAEGPPPKIDPLDPPVDSIFKRTGTSYAQAASQSAKGFDVDSLYSK